MASASQALAQAQIHYTLGNSLRDAGRLTEAAEQYRQALAVCADHADAANNLGVLLKYQGRSAEAVDCFRQALRGNSRHADAYNNLGAVLGEQGRRDEEIECYRQALRYEPNNASAHANLGAALQEAGNLAEASASFQEAARLDPRHVEALHKLGCALYEQGHRSEAAVCFHAVLRVKPDHGEALNNLGHILLGNGSRREALEVLTRAVTANPRNAEAHNNLGIALKEDGRPTEASASFRRALAIDPRHTDSHNGLAATLVYMGQFDLALEHYDLATRFNPAHAAARFNRALWRLQHGEYLQAWPDYEQRWALPDNPARSFTRPQWDGTNLNGKTLLVYAEQGLGDTIQFVRYLPMVKKMGRVVFECQPPLVGLCQSAAGIDQLVPRGAPLPDFDVHIPLLSLPGIFGTTPESIPGPVPYLHADARLAERWRQELEPLKGLKIGIAWQGNPTNKGDCYRSVALRHFEPLAKLRGAQLVSLQRGAGVEQLATASFPVTSVGERLDPNSLDDLGAVLMNLDLVVTIETALAHLAGALGRPAWVALSVAGDWRWLRERDDSPWYPTLRLFRQKHYGDWSEVFGRIAQELRARMPALQSA